MTVKKIILAGLAIGVINFAVSMLVSAIFGMIFPSINAEYQNLELFRAKTDPLMLLFFAHPFLVGILLAWFWAKVKNAFGEDVRGGVKFGLVYWIIATIPGMFATYSSMPYSFAIVMSWTVAGLVAAVVAGVISSKMLKN